MVHDLRNWPIAMFAIYNGRFPRELKNTGWLILDGMLNIILWIYAIEGEMALWVQETFKADWLTAFMTHFMLWGSWLYVMFQYSTLHTLMTGIWLKIV